MTDHITHSASQQRAQRSTKAYPGAFASVSESLLRDTSALLAWRQANLGRRPSDNDLLFVLAAAERALEHGRNKAALFVSVVKGDRRELISAAQDDRAAQRLRDFRTADSGKSTYARALAEALRRKD